MLTLYLPEAEFFNEKTLEFIKRKEYTLNMEHSLIAIFKWEEKFKKPFLDDKNNKSKKEMAYYYKCMTLTPNVPDELFEMLFPNEENEIMSYITEDHTASTIKNDKKEGEAYNPKQFITSELVYSWMCLNKIPKEYEKWHFSRLMILIRMVAEQKAPPKKKNHRQAARDYAAMNKARREKYHSKG